MGAQNPMAVQELVDYCIDFLFDSVPDLKACALVNRSWLATAQLHLFNQIVIGSSGYSYGESALPARTRQRCIRLFQVLSASPRLLGLVRGLWIHVDTTPDDTMDAISLFPFLRLQQISVSGNWVGRALSATQALFALPTLIKISIAGNFRSLADFAWILQRCSPTVRDVSFCRVSIAPGGLLSDPSPPLPRIEIESLDLWWSDRIHDWLNSAQCHFGFTNLKQLRLNENTTLPQWPAFSASISRIEHLQFQPQVPGPAIIDLAPFTRLRSIEIFLEYRDDVSPALETLSTIAPVNQLATLRLRVGKAHLPDAALGAELDARISSLALPHLQAVELVYRVQPRAFAAVAGTLPLLNARRLVRVRAGD
ncbi:hypothetical protein B0H15DRAFT_1018174 [Mycena belliarum]|uniref:Uncharacterized protein n=1 Tax=Mycena belliarum TaxID=1033014 RepID=A0AAD6UGZ5_9AGAR|nr:hypothetical protein B0H15DRAFT_1018174 [Mycena belliae]